MRGENFYEFIILFRISRAIANQNHPAIHRCIEFRWLIKEPISIPNIKINCLKYTLSTLWNIQIHIAAMLQQ